SSMSRIRRGALLSLAVASLSGSALAEPSLWARTKNPRAAAEAKLEGSLQRAFDEAEMSSLLGLGLNHRVLRRAAATFEGEGEPEDPELALLEARVLVGADIGREADARRLLENAIPRLPDGTRAASAWNTLA